MKLSIVTSLLLALLLSCGAALAANDIGTVISAKPGVFALRSGKEVPLSLKDRVMSTDVLYTNASGRLQIILDDDSTIALASDTRLELVKVVPTGKPEFKANVPTGLARFITGKIVEQNPEGFSVVTPKGTVGIRGTILSVRAGDGSVTVYVTNTTRGGVHFEGSHIPSGSWMTIAADGSIEQGNMTQEQNNSIEKNVQAGFAQGTVTAEGEAETSDGKKETVYVAEEQNLLPTVSGQTTPNQGSQQNTTPELPKNLQASVSGNFNMALQAAPSVSVPFSLNVHLTSGTASGQVNLPAFGTSTATGNNMLEMTGADAPLYFSLNSPLNIGVSGSITPTDLAVSGSVPGVGSLYTGQVSISDPTGSSGILYPHTANTNLANYDVASLGVSLQAPVTTTDNTVALNNGSGTLSLQFAQQPGYSLGDNIRDVLEKALNDGTTITAPISDVNGSGPIVSK